MTWAARLKQAFNIDIKTCEACGGAVKVIAYIDDPVIINKKLAHLHFQQHNQVMLPPSASINPALERYRAILKRI